MCKDKKELLDKVDYNFPSFLVVFSKTKNEGMSSLMIK